MCERGHQLSDAFLDTLGDDDLALARQQLHGAHLAHVHAHRVSGSAGFLFYSGQSSGGFGCGDLVCGAVALRHQQLIGIRCLLKHLNAHVVDHLDDVFDLIGIRDVLRQVIVDFGVGQIPLFFSLCNQGFKSGLLMQWVGHTKPAVVRYKKWPASITASAPEHQCH